jgi:enterochelin esterase family protein
MKTGRVELVRFESEVLKGNAGGDPHRRTVPVYLPPSYDRRPTQRYPVAYVLTGFTGRGRMLLNDNLWNPPLDVRMDALVGEGCGEMILVMPDCATRYGGSQYLDSSATGRYETHLIAELVPFVDRTFRTLAAREHRGVLGKSSGGYGALVQGMRHPEVFGAVACHSGDMYFEYCYRGDVPKFCARVQNAGGLTKWFAEFQAARQKKHEDLVALNILAMAAAYSPNPAATPFGIDLPCDLETGAFRDGVWERWLAHDPILMLERHAEALRSMKLLFLDCGIRDEWHLHLGLRILVRRLGAAGIRHEVEEFDDGHMNVQYRYDVSLPKLARAIGAGR